MDLVGAEGRRGGTRGGRGAFTWDSVAPEERSYYLGNSAGGSSAAALPPSARRRAVAQGPSDWYVKPKDAPEPSAAPPSAPGRSASYRNPFGGVAGAKGGSATSEADAVRRRERAMLDAALGGRSFSDAVRAALTESVASGVDDDGVSSGDGERTKMRGVVTSEMRDEKAWRKAERARRREQRLIRRAKRRDSSESEREGMRSRRCEESDRRRRRRERESDREEENRRSTIRPRSGDDGPGSDSATAQRARRRPRHR